jgi:hypothetical protein
MSRTLSSLLCAILFWFGVGVAGAVTFTVDSKSVPGLNPKTPIVLNSIQVTGLFEPGDADRLRTLLTRLRTTSVATPGMPLATASLSSPGGDLYEGLNVGYLFKEFDVATLVHNGDLCLSACALAFLGGTASHSPPTLVPNRSIQIGGQVGFHNFYINPRSPSLPATNDAATNMTTGFNLARGGSSLLVRYAAAMSLDPAFVARMLGRPSEEWEYIDIDGEFVDLSSCPIGLDRPKVSQQSVATNICNHSIGGFSLADPSQARRLTERDAKKDLLEQVEQSLDTFAVKGPLFGQLAGVIASRDDRLIDAVYSDLRLAGIPLPEFVGPVFKVSGYVTGPYQMQCLVSLSLDNPDKYEVAIQGPAGMTHAFRSAPPNCRRLFLFDRNDMLNPPKR